MDNTSPSLRTKAIFWLLLSMLSVALAEVTVGSAPFAFLNPAEFVFLTVFYGTHLLVFAWVAFRRGWPTLPTLWFAGVLFGMYEFYITKVLWVPPWGDLISMGHIDIISFIVLALFWHPFMAFIFPLLVGETIGTNSNWMKGQLPRLARLSTQRAKLAFVAAALLHGLVMTSIDAAIASTISATASVALVSLWWRRKRRHRQWSLLQLLPNHRQGMWLTGLLAAQYLVFVPTWTPNRMPPFVGHLIVWLLYAGFALLLHSAKETSQNEIEEAAEYRLSRSQIWLGAGALLALSAIGALGPISLGYVIVWLGAGIVGLRIMYSMVLKTLHKPEPSAYPMSEAKRP